MGDEVLTAGEVARRLGVAVTTLRTWHRRYGLGPSGHQPGRHRRYTQADLARLDVMRRLTAQGVAPAEAARWARHGPLVPAPRTPQRVGAVRDGGAVRVGRAGPAARGLARAAMRLDSAAMGDLIERALVTDGVVATWDTMLRPVLAAIGARHADTGRLIETEHLLSRCASEALATVARRSTRTAPGRILLCCADEEQHTLPLEALAAALAEAGVGCRLLGARVPVEALLAAVDRTGPAAVVIWSHSPVTGDTAQLDALLAVARRPLLLVAAGPGWPAETLPSGVTRPATLAEALALTLAVGDVLDRPDPLPHGERVG